MDEAEDALRAITAGEIDAFVVSDGESGQRVFSLMRDAFFTLDVGWRYTYLNDQAQGLTARTRDEVLGRTIWKRPRPSSARPPKRSIAASRASR